MRVERFQWTHLNDLDVQDAQRQELAALDATVVGPVSYTALVNGRPVACAGLTYENGTAVAWALLGRDAGRHLVGLTRYVQAALTVIPEVYAYAGFPAGCRWLELLGFRRTGESANLGGRRHELYVRQT